VNFSFLLLHTLRVGLFRTFSERKEQ